MYVVNVKYSENLGDGVIAECIEKMGFFGDKVPVSFDLSSKVDYYSKSGLKSSGVEINVFENEAFLDEKYVQFYVHNEEEITQLIGLFQERLK